MDIHLSQRLLFSVLGYDYIDTRTVLYIYMKLQSKSVKLFTIIDAVPVDFIDPAVLRPGRLDKILYVGLPPPSDRHAILLTITRVTRHAMDGSSR